MFLIGNKIISDGVAKLAASLKDSSAFIKTCKEADADSIKDIPLADKRKLKQELKALTKSFSEYTEEIGKLSRTLGISIKDTQISNAKERPTTTVSARLDENEARMTELLSLVKGLTDNKAEQ